MSKNRHVFYMPDIGDREYAYYSDNEETVSIGELVNEDDFILTLEAVKFTSDILSPASGVLTRIFVEDDKPIKLGDPICEVMTIETDAQILEAARRILQTRFPADFERLDELLSRIDAQRISKSYLVMGTGTIDEIILKLAND